MRSKKPDLSFTENPTWKQEREVLWAPLEVTLKEAYRKKDIAARKIYFFTGEITNDFKEGGKVEGDTSLLEWFPLPEAAGWDYVLSELTPRADIYEYEYYHSILGPAYGISGMDSKLRYFDYFHPSMFQPLVRSRVPVGKEGSIVEFTADPIKICENMASQFIGFILKDRQTHCYFRRKYFFDLLSVLNDEKSCSSENLRFSIPLFMRQALKFEPRIMPGDPGPQKQFLSDFVECVEALPKDSVLRSLLNNSI